MLIAPLRGGVGQNYRWAIETQMKPQKPRRRWFRFRLRTLLIVLVTVLSVTLGWVGWETYRIAR